MAANPPRTFAKTMNDLRHDIIFRPYCYLIYGYGQKGALFEQFFKNIE